LVEEFVKLHKLIEASRLEVVKLEGLQCLAKFEVVTKPTKFKQEL
jgi:hypothetical protein